uniref:Uncharacterized protein n=1 Tax=Nelumbo nucifera TaxID=4432 RepID=A0A822YX00_NELNU|nr:TPA_asm: hypothetical protein HUJ06_005926 [Nelumbo nucifera]
MTALLHLCQGDKKNALSLSVLVTTLDDDIDDGCLTVVKFFLLFNLFILGEGVIE